MTFQDHYLCFSRKQSALFFLTLNGFPSRENLNFNFYDFPGSVHTLKICFLSNFQRNMGDGVATSPFPYDHNFNCVSKHSLQPSGFYIPKMKLFTTMSVILKETLLKNNLVELSDRIRCQKSLAEYCNPTSPLYTQNPRAKCSNLSRN